MVDESARGDLFESSVRSVGDLAGVFEYDGDAGYFYLYETKPIERVRDAIEVVVGRLPLSEADVVISWSPDETTVHLYLMGMEWARYAPEHRKKWAPKQPLPAAPTPDLVERNLRPA